MYGQYECRRVIEREASQTDGDWTRVEDFNVVDVLQQDVDSILLHRELIDVHSTAGAVQSHHNHRK